jgi:hypothetical protein
MRLLAAAFLLLVTTSCVPTWSVREIASKADKGLVSKMAGEWTYVPSTNQREGDRLALSMLPGKTSTFRYSRAGNTERWVVNPVKIGNRTFADIRLLSSENDSITIAPWSVPADTLTRYHLFARLDLDGEAIQVRFLDDDATARWLDETDDRLDYAQIDEHGTDVTLLDKTGKLRTFLRNVQSNDSLFTPPIRLVRSRLAGGDASP